MEQERSWQRKIEKSRARPRLLQVWDRDKDPFVLGTAGQCNDAMTMCTVIATSTVIMSIVSSSSGQG